MENIISPISQEKNVFMIAWINKGLNLYADAKNLGINVSEFDANTIEFEVLIKTEALRMRALECQKAGE